MGANDVGVRVRHAAVRESQDAAVHELRLHVRPGQVQPGKMAPIRHYLP